MKFKSRSSSMCSWVGPFPFALSCSLIPAGNPVLMDAMEMVKELLPEFHLDRRMAEDERFHTVAVFCQGDYAKALQHAGLNHWVPGLLSSEVDFSESQMKHWSNVAKKSVRKEIKALQDHSFRVRDDASLHASCTQEIECLKVRLENFLQMQQYMFEEHGVICQDARGDGNCAVYTVLSLIKDISAPSLSLEDVRVFREDLSRLWRTHSEVPMWQEVWRVLRQNLGSNRGLNNEEKPKQGKQGKQQSPLPFTPDKVAGSKRLLPGGVRLPTVLDLKQSRVRFDVGWIMSDLAVNYSTASLIK